MFSTRTIMVTPEMAGKMLDTMHYEHQRKLSVAHVEYLRDLMAAGEFRSCAIITAECFEDGNTYLLDGYHRLHAILQWGKPVELVLIEWTFEFKKEVDDLFVTIDGGKSRTVGQRIQPYIPEGLTTQQASILAGSAAYIEGEFSRHEVRGYTRMSPKARLAAICEWKPDYTAVHEALIGSTHPTWRTFLRIPVMSVALVIMRYQPQRATKFLEEIAAEDRLVRHSPVWQFHSKIVPRVAVGGSYWSAYVRTIAPIWNAYYENRPVLTNLIPQATDRPVLLLGTPFNRKEKRGEEK